MYNTCQTCPQCQPSFSTARLVLKLISSYFLTMRFLPRVLHETCLDLNPEMKKIINVFRAKLFYRIIFKEGKYVLLAGILCFINQNFPFGNMNEQWTNDKRTMKERWTNGKRWTTNKEGMHDKHWRNEWQIKD